MQNYPIDKRGRNAEYCKRTFSEHQTAEKIHSRKMKLGKSR